MSPSPAWKVGATSDRVTMNHHILSPVQWAQRCLHLNSIQVFIKKIFHPRIIWITDLGSSDFPGYYRFTEGLVPAMIRTTFGTLYMGTLEYCIFGVFQLLTQKYDFLFYPNFSVAYLTERQQDTPAFQIDIGGSAGYVGR